MADLKKLTDIINKSLVGKTVTIVKHRAPDFQFHINVKRNAVCKVCPIELPRRPTHIEVPLADGRGLLRLPPRAHRRLLQALENVDALSELGNREVVICREGEGVFTDYRVYVKRLEAPEGVMIPKDLTFIVARPGAPRLPDIDTDEPSYEARPVGLVPGPALKAEVLAVQAKKAICQCSMRDLMSGVPHRSDCPEKPR